MNQKKIKKQAREEFPFRDFLDEETQLLLKERFLPRREKNGIRKKDYSKG